MCKTLMIKKRNHLEGFYPIMTAAGRLVLFLGLVSLVTVEPTKPKCLEDMWKTGLLTLDMVTVSSHTSDKDEIKPNGTGWCGDEGNGKDNWVEIDFTHPTIVHQLQLVDGGVQDSHIRQVQILTMFDKHTEWYPLGQTYDTHLDKFSSSWMNVAESNIIKIRINILTFDKKPCMKVNILGCLPKDICPSCQHGGQCLQQRHCRCPTGFNGDNCESETNMPPASGCSIRQGLADSSLSSDHLHVSSSSPGHGKDNGRLNYCCGDDPIGGWCPAITDKSPWYEVKFPTPVAFGGLEIKPPSTLGVLSSPTAFMKSYRLEVIMSVDPLKQWRTVAQSLEAIANSSITKNFLTVSPHVAIDAVKIYPLNSESQPCFRFEVLGCDPSKQCPIGYCTNGGSCVGQNQCTCLQGFYGADCSITSLTTHEFHITSIVHQVIHTTSTLTFNVHGSVNLVTTSLGQAISVTGSNSYVSVGTSFSSCLKDIRRCSAGFTIKLNVKFSTLEDNTYIISNGGDRPNGMGLALYYANNHLYYVVATDTMMWRLQINGGLSLNVWHHLQLSWSISSGVELLDNDKLIGSITRPVQRPSTSTHIIAREITLGYGFTQTSTHVSMLFNGLATFDASRTELVHQGVITVPPTTVTTAITTKPSTAMTPQPTTSQPTTKVVMTSPAATTKHPVQSFNFSFIQIIDNILITPLHNFTVHGKPYVIPEPAGSAILVLNTTGQFVELPNIGMQCLQDLTTCDNGFTLSVEIKFINSTITDKQYIFSSGGDQLNTSGIALYLWKGDLYCSVKWDQTIWVAKTHINFNHTTWHTYQVSWNKVDGFVVYVDGQLFMNATIKLPNPVQPDVNSLLIAKGHGSSTTTFLDIRNLYAWTASRDVLIHQHILQEYTTVKTTPSTTIKPATSTTPRPPTTLMPTTSSHVVSFYWSFTQLNQSNIIKGDNLTLHVFGGATVDQTKFALHITQSIQYIDFGTHTDLCLGNLDKCTTGITFEVVLEFHSLQENTVIMSSGGEKADGTGLALIYRFGQIQCVVTTSTLSWFATIPRGKLTLNSFNTITISWAVHHGLILYVDKQIVDFTTTPMTHPVLTNTAQHLYFGRPPTSTPSLTSTQVNFYLKTINCWQVWIDIIIDIDIIIGYPPSKVTTTRQPATTRATTPTTTKVTTKAPTTPAPPASSTEVCHKGWICKDDITTPKSTTTKKPTPTPRPATPKPTTVTTTTRATTTPTTTTPRPTKPGLPNYPNHPTIRPGVDGKGSAFFTCSFEKSFENNVEFVICLNINGNCELMNIVSGLTDHFTFTVANINDNLFNKQVSCSLQVRFKGQSGLTGKLTSNVFTPTLQLVTTGKLTLIEGRPPQYIQVNSTAPPQMFCCRGCRGTCTVIIQAHIDLDRHDKKCGPFVLPQVVVGWKGPSQSPKADLCGTSLSLSSWHSVIQIPVTAMVDNMYDRDHSNHVTVQALVTYPRQPPIVTTTSLTLNIGRVDVVAKDNDHKAMCASINDPHMTTFDGRRYNNFNTGEFILYRHKTLPYEVRADYRKCSSRRSSRPSCNCAVAIKSGDDVITFSSCGSHGVSPTMQHGHHHSHHHPAPSPITIQMFKNGDLTPGTIIRRLGSGQKYEVHLPTGTVVTVQSSVRPFINIWVKPSSLDYTHTEGLCGSYDRNHRNDVLDSHGRPDNHREPNHFSMKWHVTSSSIFTGVAAATVPGITHFCSCVKGRQVYCVNSHGTMRCLNTRYDITSIIVAQAKLPQLSRHRGKRQASGSVIPTSPEVLPEITLDYTIEEAKEVCSNAIYNTSVTQHCDSVVNATDIAARIDNCAADLNDTGDDVWALDSIKDIVEECLGELDKTPVTTNSSVPEINTTGFCTEECQNGNCTQGVCQCEEGYSGTACSLSALTTTPTVNARPPNDEGCDVRQSSGGCQTVMILGENFVQSSTLTCHYTYVEVTSSVQTRGSEMTVKAQFVNMYQVSCSLPRANTGALIRVSNDGASTSNNQYFHLVFDSTCFDCAIANVTLDSSCNRKGDNCVIDGACFAKDESKTGEKHQVCKPDSSTSEWTDTCGTDPACSPSVEASTQEDTSDDHTEIIVLAVVCAVLGFGFLVAVVYILKNRSKKSLYKKYEVHKDQKKSTTQIPEVVYDNKLYSAEGYRM